MGLFDKPKTRKPDMYPWANEVSNALWASFWTANEFSFQSDHKQFHTDMTEEERQVVVRTLSAIGQVEIAVKRFWVDLGVNMPHDSISNMGIVMGQNEVIHNVAYEKLLEKLQLWGAFDAVLEEPVVKGRVEYLKKYLEKVYKDDRKQYIYALILFTLFVENTSLFGQFYTIMHFNKFDKVLKDTAQQVQYTRLEESLHAKVGIGLINQLRVEYPHYFDEELEERVKEECQIALQYEEKIVEWMLGGYTRENLSPTILNSFLKNRLSEALVEAGFEGIPIDTGDKDNLKKTLWMDEETYGMTMTDFFQKRPVEYNKGTVKNDEALF